MKLGRCRALYPGGAQGPPLLLGEHHLPAEPLQVSPWLEPGESGTRTEARELRRRHVPVLALEPSAEDEQPCVYASFISSDDVIAYAMMLAQSGESVIGLQQRAAAATTLSSACGGGTLAVPPKTTSKSGVGIKATRTKGRRHGPYETTANGLLREEARL